MKILFKNITVVDSNNTYNTDVLVDNEIYEKIGKNLNEKADRVIDGNDLVMMPGLFDMHVHFRDPGFEYKETIKTGCKAALYGGVTGVACMPNTNPVIDSSEIVNYIINESVNTGVKVYPYVSATKSMLGNEINNYSVLKASGAIAVSDDGKPIKNAEIMKKAMISAQKNNMLIASHCEDLDIIDGGIINKGSISEKLGVKGMDRLSENIVTIREMLIAEEVNAAIHICHVSTKESVDAIRFAKSKGVKVTCETAPHYFILTDEKLLSKDADYRMNPPLRTEEDIKAILDGILDGTIDAIVTDHAPHSEEDKRVFEKAPNGVVGLETSLAATLTYLYHTGKVSLSKIVDLMSTKPRQLLGIEPLYISEGKKAEFIIVNTNEEWDVIPEKLHSKSHNTVFKHMKLKGKVKSVYTDKNYTELI